MSASIPRAEAAPEGTTWVCGACGKSTKDLASFGDESCRTWAVLCDDSTVERDQTGRVVRATAVENDDHATRAGDAP